MRLRVLSLNVWGLPSPVGHRVEERLALVSRDLPALECDLAFFQEVWTDAARDQLVADGRRLGYPHVFHLPGPARAHSGLLALSRWPILGTGFRRFTLCGLPQRLTQMDYYSGKGLARVDVNVDGVPVAFFNTHLHARYAPAKAVDEYRGHRTAEVIEIAEDLRQQRGPVVAVGDFNMRDSAPEYRVLAGLTGIVDAAAATGDPQPTATLQNPYRLARGAVSESRIDYVFSRDGVDVGVRPVSCRRVFDEDVEVAGEPGAYSDHAGVVADLEIGGAGSLPPPPSEDLFSLARVLLDEGRFGARRRQAFERASAGASAVAAVLAIRKARVSRRRFLRLSLGVGAGAATIASGGLLGLSERFVPEELAGFEDAIAALARLRDTAPTPG